MEIEKTTRWLALLRGVNVGGVKVLMQPLKEMAENLGWSKVKTYIASGNLVFSAKGNEIELANLLRSTLKADTGIDTPIIVFSAEKIQSILADHPWQPEKGNQSHIYFCWDNPIIDSALYADLKAPDEDLRLINGHLHFYAPSGIGRSKLAEKLGKVVQGSQITGRNLNTVRKLADMVQD